MRRHGDHPRPTIGVFSYGFSGNFLWAGATAAARQHDVNLIGFAGGSLHSPRGFEAQANVLFDLIDPQQIDGLLLDSGILSHYVGTNTLHEFCGRYAGMPIVSSEVALKGIPSVLLDFYQGIRDLIGHLITAHGCRRVAFIRGPQESQTAEERYHAYRKALAEYDIPFDPDLVAPGTFFAPSGAEAIRLLLDERRVAFDAIAAANDWMALDAMQAMQARGIRVPADVAVVGFDDQKEAGVAVPPLTTVQLGAEQRGYRGIELLLARLAGEEVAEQVILPAQLVLHQSCGCPSAIVVQAAAGECAVSSSPVADLFTINRETILTKMNAALPVEMYDPAWLAELLESFSAELGGETERFLRAFKAIVQRVGANDGDLSGWHDALSALRRCVRPALEQTPLLARAEDLWQQARTLLGEAIEQARTSQMMQAGQQIMTLQALGQTLLSVLDVSELMDILAQKLPQVGIPSCYLSLYADPEHPAATSHLILAYDETGRIQVAPDAQYFPSRQLVPAGILPHRRRYTLTVEALYFRERQLGFALFEEGADNFLSGISQFTGIPGENPLRGQISSALQADLLVQQVQEHAAELAREKYVTDTFLETVPDQIYFKDCQSRITRANNAHALRFGLTNPREELGKTDFDFFQADVAHVQYAEEQAIIQTGQAMINKEVAETSLDGQERWSLVTKMPLRDERGEIIGTFGISRDITALKFAEQELVQYRDHLSELVKERTADLSRSNARLHAEIVDRERMEQALRSSEQQYRLLAENVPDGIVIVQNGGVAFSNAAFGNMAGYAPERLTEIDLMQVFHAPARQMLHACFEQKEPASVQAELLRPDGRALWTEIECAAIVWNGQPAFLLTIHNITERKLREQQLEEERARLQQENLNLKSTIKERYRFGELVGKSPAMQRIYELMLSAASSDVNVLIVGESGTGKELIARTLHQISPRKTKPFVAVNCASIPETLFEREFFGHRKGAFTGADKDTPGLFDRAHQGIMFLDEVTELTPGTQAKLLRVLQDGSYTPLGSNIPRQADVLMLAATNKPPQEEIAQGRLRKDFFYRIGVIELAVPPLRERKDDLPLLLEYLLEQYCQKQAQIHGKLPADLPTDHTQLPGELAQALYAYDWPGNVRELQNVLQRYLVTRDLATILHTLGSFTPSVSPVNAQGRAFDVTLPKAIEALEKQMIAEALATSGYHIGKTSELLDMPRRTLQNKLKKYAFTLKRVLS
ncbi:PAS modulated sigma54 specific transcriptional regulator, Fis family [Candidatus Moduliflexus flocculans]|uniref:PAS modulated sigma54 specific transcriptional regulator, Fis family n=1 Tax=Candidatus Moduliflexus flocculans TaxID=1499966 RepID=A0A0S6VRU6_9BACT|nr:PAS modulated sigma54 specific transcriptional regulator, Fis family [Candidatus Moduliflexus flocculans]